jgi:DNA-nicking Smr family endonuclease
MRGKIMARKKKKIVHPMHRASQRRSSSHAFYTPFKGLDQHLARISANERAFSYRPERFAVHEPLEEAEKMFLEAMEGVVPLARKNEERVPPVSPRRMAPRFSEEEELDAYTCLVNLVKGDAPFELSYSDEYVDGAVVGLSPGILKRLRKGYFSYQDYVDLHGYNREQARKVVVSFIRESFAEKRRCVLIVSGRGLNSQDKQPVLKQSLVDWLTHAPLRRFVLAFASARSYDGGSGALYVLLRRNQRNTKIMTPAV